MMQRKGYDRLWAWFGCSRASWLTIPRVLMHEMPDEWQEKMAELLEQFDSEWNTSDMPNPIVMAKNGNRLTKWPEWILNYRRPCKESIKLIRAGVKA